MDYKQSRIGQCSIQRRSLYQWIVCSVIIPPTRQSVHKIGHVNKVLSHRKRTKALYRYMEKFLIVTMATTRMGSSNTMISIRYSCIFWSVSMDSGTAPTKGISGGSFSGAL